MQLHEIIRARRMALGLTQQQLADRLSVTGAAVSKWERAMAYPDAALLPALARLLGTDMNELFAFRESLSDTEIDQITRSIANLTADGRIDEAFALAEAHIRDYPRSERLLYQAAVLLNAALLTHPDARTEARERTLDDWFSRACSAAETDVRLSARASCIGRFAQRGEYERAQALLDELPDAQPDKRQLHANLLIAQERYREARTVLEQSLCAQAGSLYATMTCLSEITLKEGLSDRSAALSERAAALAQLTELCPYFAQIARLPPLLAANDVSAALECLNALADSLEKPWHVRDTLFYADLPDSPDSEAFAMQSIGLRRMLLRALDDESAAFLRAHPDFEPLKRRLCNGCTMQTS